MIHPGGDSAASNSHDHGGDGGGSYSADPRAHGPGAAARNSIGTVLVTGMIIGTAFTLFVVPAIYVVVAKTRKKVSEPTVSLCGTRSRLSRS